MGLLTLGLWAVLGPLLVAVLLLLVGPLRRRGDLAAGLSLAAATGSVVASATLCWRLLASLGQGEATYQWVWLVTDGVPIATMGMMLDGVSLPMLLAVSVVALCVQVFSLAYLAHESPAARGRYFAWHSLFLFAMSALVVAPNLLQLFVAWELVGLCSYLLIGFYYRRPAAARAALKAFWVTKLADIGLLLGLIVQYVAVGSFGWDVDTVFALRAAGWVPTGVAALYLVAVMGKSAQFPLHVWLPDAMEGPTPVSALLHAATMVAAGVYLVVRAFPIFESAPMVLAAMAVVGGFTALFAALLALVQTDLKRMLAYSTSSQLGYMLAALGAGGLFAGYFHLLTHAFFKALLFLAAGSVIHAVHSNDLRAMGGLWGRMRLTTFTFVAGALALAGAPLTSGYFSKDLVLEALWQGNSTASILWLPLLACLATVFLTALYMTRAVLRAFFGALSEQGREAHEGGWAMTLPLVVLAVLALGAGFAGPVLEALAVNRHPVHLLHLTPIAGLALALALAGAGAGVALRADAPGVFAPLRRAAEAGVVDRVWAWCYRAALRVGARGIAWIDRYVVDGAMNALGAAALAASARLRRLQTGVVSDYLYVVAVGVVCLAVWSQLVAGGGP